MATISVLMPVRNGGGFLSAAISSVLQQTKADFELLVVDDHSDDGALDVLPKDARIKRIQNAGEGLVDALNTGLKQAQGDYLARMDADDVCHPQRLAKQYQFLQQNPVDVVASEVEIFSDSGALGRGYQDYQEWLNRLCETKSIARERFIENPVPHPAMFWRRSSVGDDDYQTKPWAEDYDWVLRGLEGGLRFAKVPEVLLRWRHHSQRTSQHADIYQMKAMMRCKAHYLLPRLQGSVVVIAAAGKRGGQWGRLLQQAGIEIEAFIDVTAKPGQQRIGLPVWGIEALGHNPGNKILLSVAPGHSARGFIRQQCHRHYEEGQNLWFLA